MPGNLQAPDRTHLNRVRADIGQRAPLPLLLILPLPRYRSLEGILQLFWYFSRTNLTIATKCLLTIKIVSDILWGTEFFGGVASEWAYGLWAWRFERVTYFILCKFIFWSFYFKANWQLARQLWWCMWNSHTERSCSLEYVTHTMSGIQSHRENLCLWHLGYGRYQKVQ